MGVRGTVGTVIGYQWRGKWCLRARPRSVRNPRTERQQLNRTLFREVVRYAGALKGVLHLGMHARSLAAHMTPCNYFIHSNKDCFSMVDGRLAVDYEGLVVSEGPVAPVAFAAPAVGEDRVITVPFEKNPLHARAEAEDAVYLFALCPDLGASLLSSPAYRRTKCVSLVVPDEWAGHEVHLYGFVADYAGRASDSVYLGCGVLGERTLEGTAEYLESEGYKKDLASSPKSCTFAPCYGEMAERSIAAVLKTVDLRGSGGSNPSLSANFLTLKKTLP